MECQYALELRLGYMRECSMMKECLLTNYLSYTSVDEDKPTSSATDDTRVMYDDAKSRLFDNYN